MVAHVGRLRFLRRGTPTGSPPQSPLVAAIRETGIEVAGEPVDVTNNDSNGWRELIDAAQMNTVSIPISGVRVSDALLSEWINGAQPGSGTRLAPTAFIFPLETGETNPAQITGNFYLSEYSETGSHDGEITFDATLMSSGEITYTPGT